MSAVSTQFTLADLERMPDDGIRREILFGELIELPPRKHHHENVVHNILFSLMVFVVAQKLGRVYGGTTGYQLFTDRKTWLEPDVSYVRSDRVLQTDPDGYIQGAPELAVEIISPSESAQHVSDKVEAYLRAGSHSVVLVYPKSRRLELHSSDGKSARLRETDTLRIPDLLPGWELPLALWTNLPPACRGMKEQGECRERRFHAIHSRGLGAHAR